MHPITQVPSTHAPLWQKLPAPHGINDVVEVGASVSCKSAGQVALRSLVQPG
jgi:hypothetical protein